MKKRITFLILSVLICTISSAQINGPTVKFPSPSAAELGRFSAAKVGLYTGTAQYSIPIYEFKTPNLTLPITLDYSSNGLMVDKISSWVGFDWSLNVGGVINRFRKGKVDRPGARPAYPTDWYSWTATGRYNYLQSYVSNTADLEPDEFIFNFPNYSGKFVFDGNGAPVLIPYANLKIETNTSGQSYTFFKITTPDGIIYRFENVAYTYPTTEPSFISSWYLTQIIHPLGDIITFNYTNISLTQYIGVSQSATEVVSAYGDSPVCNGGQVTEKVNSVYNDALFLSNINFQNYGSITFEKYLTRQDSYQDYQLKKISIRDNSNVLIKSFEFFQQFPLRSTNYQSKTNLGITEPNSEHNKRMFLDSLQIQANDGSRVGSYSFYYNNLDQLPARYSYAQDHWGYFNGKSNNDFAVISEVPTIYQNYFTNAIPTVSNRNPDYTYSQKGMLQKIVFPTRGFTTLEYEPNKNSTNNDLGGCRVLRTKTYESNAGTPDIRKYIYANPLNSTDYRYYNQYTINDFYANCIYKSSCVYGVLSSNSSDNLFVNGINNVIYSNIEILLGENGENGKEVHQFYNNIDVPATPINGSQIYPLVKNNTGWKGGLLASNYNTNAGLSKVWEKDLTYNFAETRNLKTINCLAVEWLYAPGCQPVLDNLKLQQFNVVPYTLSSVWYYINQEQITNYQSNGNVISTVNYFYDNYVHAQLTREETTDSKGNLISKRTYYPQDYSTSSYNLGTLISNRIINVPVDTRKYINNVLDQGQQTMYNIYGQPTDIYMAETTNGADVALNLTNPYTLTHKATYGYDSYNKMNQVTLDNNSSTTYLWGYNKAYPVAKIENATLTEVQTALGGSIPDLGTGGLSVSQNTSLRNGLPNALVTTYTYTPLIGITSQTDPNGLTTYYQYDSYGRLKLIKDKDGKILKVNDYHYSTSN